MLQITFKAIGGITRGGKDPWRIDLGLTTSEWILIDARQAASSFLPPRFWAVAQSRVNVHYRAVDNRIWSEALLI